MTDTLTGYAKTLDTTNEVITVYQSSPYEPIPQDPSYVVIVGSFVTAKSASARLNVLAYNRGPATLSVILYENGQATGARLTVSSDKLQRFVSDEVTIQAGSYYQVGVIYTGTEGEASVNTVWLGAP